MTLQIDVLVEDNLKRFANMLNSIPCQMEKWDYSSNDNTAKLRAYILPKDISWPMFTLRKQSDASCKNIYLCRTSPADTTRRNATLEKLKAGESVVWVGFPGIGKSSDINYILMKLLSHIGQVDWPSIVAFRFDGNIAEFQHESSSSSVIRITWYNGKDKDDILRYTMSVRTPKGRAVLVLDLDDIDIKPDSDIPVLIAMSSRGIQGVLKSLQCRQLTEFLVSPPSVGELLLMTEAELQYNEEDSYFKNLSLSDAQTVVMNRVAAVGPVPRFVLNAEKKYSNRKRLLGDSGFLPTLSDDLTRLTYDNVPGVLKLYIAPFLKDGITDPEIREVPSLGKDPRIYEFRFLSDDIALIIAKHITRPEEIRIMHCLKLNYQLAEVIIKIGMLKRHFMHPSDPDEYWNRKNWEWHSDPGYSTLLSHQTKLFPANIPSLPLYAKEITFSGVFLNMSAISLASDVLYRSLSHNMAVGEFLSVDHTTKTVYVYQVTLSDIKNHPFKAKVIEKLMTGLKMINSDDAVSSQYTLHILCFADGCLDVVHGVKIIDDRNANIKPTPYYSVQEWNAKSGVKALKTSIIRSCLYPMDTKHELTDTTKPKI